jgi:hypothetical protein
MNILINELCNNKDSISNYDNLCKRTLKLLGRMTANFQCSATLWLLYTKILMHYNRTENEDKILNCLSKAQRALMSKSDWEKNSKDVLSNLKSLNLIYDYHMQMMENVTDQELLKRQLASFKLSSNSMITLIKNKSDYWSKDEQEIKKYLAEIKQKMNDL